MLQSSASWRQFEDLVTRILEARGFVVHRHTLSGDAGFDFVGTFQNERWAIEVKYYRTARAQPALIEAAALRVVANGPGAQAQKGMLIVSCVLQGALRSELEEKFGISFVDRIDLRIWAAVEPGLVEELDALIEADPSWPQEVFASRGDPTHRSKRLVEVEVRPPEVRGAELCHTLKAVTRGKRGWADYERVCVDVLHYLFSRDLHGWHKQKRTDDGLNRFDFICRVRPTTEFWKFLIDHVGSRYVLFEFKNYAENIKQGQILTTEKYLLERGLRRAAIILTRYGASAEALKMMQGAMREHGKLMLVVNDECVCDMLHRKDRGEDPTDCLFELADEFLLTLPR